MGLVVGGGRRRSLRPLGLGAVFGVLAVGALALPAQAMGTISGTQFSDTWTASVPIYYLAIALSSAGQQSNEVGLSCGSGSTTDSTGGPSGDLLECHFATPVSAGTFDVSGTNAWGSSVTFSFYVSTDSETYTGAGPFTITAAPSTPAPTPAPVVTPTPATTPSASAAPTPRSESKRPHLHVSGSPWFWVPLVVGFGLVAAAALAGTVDGVEEEGEEEEAELDGKKGRWTFDPERNEFHFKETTPPPVVLIPDLPVVVFTPPPCTAEQAAVAAAQATITALELEFTTACAGLDEAERLNNMGQTEASYQVLKTAANRQGTARLNLDVAHLRLARAEQALAECLGQAPLLPQGPVTPPPTPVPTSDTVLHTAGVVPGIRTAAVPPDPAPATPPAPVAPPVAPAGVYPDYSSGGGGQPLPPRRPSSIPGDAYGGDVHEPPPEGKDPPPLREPIG